MNSLRRRRHARVHHRGLHGRQHVNRERRSALIMMDTALVRVFAWTTIMVLFIAGQTTVVGWFASVRFVALLSILALILTDWGQYAASRAQLAASDAHGDVEHVRARMTLDTAAIETDIAKLAALQPGPEASLLADQIRSKIGVR